MDSEQVQEIQELFQDIQEDAAMASKLDAQSEFARRIESILATVKEIQQLFEPDEDEGDEGDDDDDDDEGP